MRKIWIIVFLILLLDQASKIYIKLNFEYGDSVEVFNWFQIHFIENPGMAYGFEFGGEIGKIVLSVLRIFLIIGIALILHQWTKKYRSNYFLIPAGLIFAGAIGNMIDGAFYGLIFDKGTVFDPELEQYISYRHQGLAIANGQGYSSFLTGCVVDMLYFPLFEITWPDWIPFVGGKEFSFFDPVFNIADSAITIGIAIFFLFNKKAFKTEITYH